MLCQFFFEEVRCVGNQFESKKWNMVWPLVKSIYRKGSASCDYRNHRGLILNEMNFSFHVLPNIFPCFGKHCLVLSTAA